jgi:hypothetical protein
LKGARYLTSALAGGIAKVAFDANGGGAAVSGSASPLHRTAHRNTGGARHNVEPRFFFEARR